MKDQNCGYCMGGAVLGEFGIPICELSVSSLILFKEQSKKGRCIVAYKDHISELVDLSDEERNADCCRPVPVAAGRPVFPDGERLG